MQAWVKFAGTPSGRMVFFFSNGPGGAISFSVNTDRTVFVTTLGVLDANSSAVVPDDGAWHHIAVVHENGVALRYYVDGVLQATRDYTGSVIYTRTQDFFTLGAEPGGGLPYVGQVDRLKVSSGVLTAEQLDSYPAMLDTDSDGMPDYWETRYGFDLNDPSDAGEDCNGDGETNLQEFQAGTHPCDSTSLTVTVNNVKDLTGNVIAANSTRDFTTHVWQSGVVLHQFWQGVGSIAALTNDSRFPDAPTFATLEPLFEYPPNGGNEGGSSYGNRLSGWFTPEATDEFIFYVCSDDPSNLYLSTDANPANKKLVAREVGYSGPRTWTGTSSGDATTKQSDTFIESEWPGLEFPAIRLEGGKKYYIEILHTEGGGGDNVGVTFGRFADFATPPANGSAPRLTGNLIGAYLDPNVELAFTEQPTDQVGVLPSAGVELVLEDFNASNGGFTVENDPATPPGAWKPWIYDATGGQWSADGSDTECGGPFNPRLTSPAYGVPQSDEVTLTFTHRYRFEGDLYDGGQVRVSVNGGAFTPVPADNFTVNGYAAGNIVGNGILNGQRAFNSDSAGYEAVEFIQSSVILGTFSQGDTIAVQFVGGWDDCWSPGQPAWQIKDLQLVIGKAAQAVTFTGAAVANAGGPTTVSYQWQRNDGAGFVDIDGATASELRFYPVAADFDATFQLVASVLNQSISSDVVKLVEGAVEPPQISVGLSSGSVVLTFTGTLVSASNPAGPYDAVEGAQSPYTVPAGANAAFYRSRE
ncbi:MAG: hypothetical protein KJ072_11150 [Verrucomicrobia bacterium]|nr:hypothetical protein [Verrucomicrobiota bacterium]